METEEILFTTQSTYSLEEYRLFNKALQNGISRVKLLRIVCMVLFGVLAAVEFFVLHDISMTIAFVLLVFLTPLIMHFSLSRTEKRIFNSNQSFQGLVSTYTFYADRIEQENNMGKMQVPYAKLYQIIETDTHFYPLLSRNQGMILVKANCSPELIAYVRQLKQTVDQRQKTKK